MEEIVFVQTPKCRECTPKPCFAKRSPCIGCERLRPREEPCKRRKTTRPKPTDAIRDALYRQMILLRGQGLSYAQIAARLNAPRSTVQAVISRSRKNNL